MNWPALRILSSMLQWINVSLLGQQRDVMSSVVQHQTSRAPSRLRACSSCPSADLRDKVTPPRAQAPKVNYPPPFPLYGHSKSTGRKGQRRDRVQAPSKIRGSREKDVLTEALIHPQHHTQNIGVFLIPAFLVGGSFFPLMLHRIAFFSLF